MSCTESVDFASFLVVAKDPSDLLGNFTRFCWRKAIESAFDDDSHLNNSFEWEDIRSDYCDESAQEFSDLQQAMHCFMPFIDRAVSAGFDSAPHSPCAKQNVTFEIDGSLISYSFYRWVLKCCLEYPPFELDEIVASAVIHDSDEGVSYEQYEYTLADI